MKEKERFLVKLGGRIQEIRVGLKLTQEVLAEKADMTPKYLGQIERGEVNPTVCILRRIAEGLHISLSDLLSLRAEIDSHIYISKIIDLLRDKEERCIRLGWKILKDVLDEMENETTLLQTNQGASP